MSENTITQQESSFKDATVIMIIWGILLVLIGASTLVSVPFSLLSLLVPDSTEHTNGTLGQVLSSLSGTLLYSGWFITMGVGTFMKKRWARSLSLLASWYLLISGICGTFIAFVILPRIFIAAGLEDAMSHEIIVIIKILFGIIFLFSYVMIPALSIIFYGNKHVRHTCETYSPKPSWTDAVPLPLLGTSLLLALTTCMLPFSAFSNFAIPAFGTMLSGIQGALFTFVLMGISGYCSWGIYQRKINALWLAIISIVIQSVSAMSTFYRMDFREYFEELNYTTDQLEVVTAIFGQTPLLLTSIGVAMVLFVGYLLYTSRYLKPEESTEII